eukprot:COSAG04_NODE_5688_length_1525_cov_22.112685_1_plen_211_part_00
MLGKKGRAELSGCTLTSPSGTGLYVNEGATATMDGGSISGCKYRVYCTDSGSTATVRPPAAAPSAAPLCPLRVAGAASAPFRRFFPPCFGPSEPRRDEKMSTAKNRVQKTIGQKNRIYLEIARFGVVVAECAVRVWAAARGHPRAERGGLLDDARRQDRGGRREALSAAVIYSATIFTRIVVAPILERNDTDYIGSGKIVADGEEWKEDS